MKILSAILIASVTSSFMASALSAEELERRLNLLNEEIQQLKTQRMGTLPPSDTQRLSGLGRAAAKVYSVSKGVSLGGYGEIVYTNFRGSDESGVANNLKPQTEVLRNIFYLGYKFNDNWVFNSEIEIEHADEIFVEFSYIDRLINENINLRAGLVLVPVGFLNLLHEPTTFLSVNRPEIEQRIIPSTWRENGIGAYGAFGKLQYQAYVVNGLNGDNFNANGLRGGRKKGGVNEDADTFAFVGRVDYNLNSQTVIGGSFYTGESTSDLSPGDIGTTLFELHAQTRYKGWYGRALYTQAQLSNLAGINAAGNNVAEKLSGFYAEVGYNLFQKKIGQSLTPFVRYEQYNTQDTVSSNITADQSRDRKNITIGIAYQPIDQVIFKADYTIKENEAQSGIDEFNAGIGYMF